MVLLREVKRLEVVSLESFLTNEQQTSEHATRDTSP